jgi:iron complex outermembrane recepter protein
MTLLALLAAGWMSIAGQAQTVTGTVRDTTGAVVPGASIVARAPAAPELSTTADGQGRFALNLPAGSYVLFISAENFRTVRVSPAANGTPLDITLSPALDASVTVTAGRLDQRLTDVAATVSVVDRTRLDRSPAMTTDDALRQVPAFSLFRRSSSIAAHPTAQGVSLRGIGPSGVSRTLVLLDGVPFNDPFGGWVSWTRAPRAALDRIEVVEGSSANLFGNYAMGGAINLVTRRPVQPWVEGTLQYGQRQTAALDASAVVRTRGWTVVIDTGGFRTDGYAAVVPEERGRVDENVSAESRRLYGSVRHAFSNGATIQGRADVFDESRQNGKRSTIDSTPEQNDTGWTSFSGAVRLPMPGNSELRATAFGDRVRFRSNFLAVPAAVPARSIGRMTLNQFVPSSGIGWAAQWTRAASRWSVVSGGVDWRSVEGESREDGLDAQSGTRVVLRRASGGAQQNLGAFIQNVITPVSPLVLTVAVRHDRWTNERGHNFETDESGAPTAGNRPALEKREDHFTAPRVSVLYKARPGLSGWSSVGWGFRAPTLNELYRQFRVGAVLTLANEKLGAERLRSVEAGVRFTPLPSVLLRGAWFDNVLEDAVSNVTLPTSPSGNVQQRQNLGLTRVRGAQADAEWHPSSTIVMSAAYIYNDAVVREFDASPALIGKRLSQVPRHRAAAQVSITYPRVGELAVEALAAGRQFDDDLNLRAIPGRGEAGLPPVATVNLLASRRVGRGSTLFAGVQNLFDARSYTGTLPTTIGAPRTVSVGVRWRPSSHR